LSIGCARLDPLRVVEGPKTHRRWLKPVYTAATVQAAEQANASLSVMP
jgi:hypothetical protein